MYGLLVHHHADAVKIIAVGHYTDDAQRFADGKPIELICGNALLAMLRESRTQA
jgi:restriction system protein